MDVFNRVHWNRCYWTSWSSMELCCPQFVGVPNSNINSICPVLVWYIFLCLNHLGTRKIVLKKNEVMRVDLWNHDEPFNRTAGLSGPEHFLSHEYYLQYQQSLNVGITRRRCWMFAVRCIKPKHIKTHMCCGDKSWETTTWRPYRVTLQSSTNILCAAEFQCIYDMIVLVVEQSLKSW